METGASLALLGARKERGLRARGRERNGTGIEFGEGRERIITNDSTDSILCQCSSRVVNMRWLVYTMRHCGSRGVSRYRRGSVL
jgi:hypothetical protein